MLDPIPDKSGLTPPQRPLVTPLSDLPQGTVAVVSEITDGPSRMRCMEMGFVAGARVRVLQTGNPTLINLNGSRIALSRQCLETILVARLTR